MKHFANTPAKLSISIFITCFLFYALTWSGHHYSIDGVVMFQYAKALAFDHSFFMNPPIVWQDSEFAVSRWAIGMTLVYIPILLILSVTFFREHPEIYKIPFVPGEPVNFELISNLSYKYCSFVNPLLTATTAVILFLLALKLNFSKKHACIAALAFGLLSPATVYAKYDFAQPLASLLLSLSFYLIAGASEKGGLKLFLTGICIGFAILTRTEFIFLLPPIFILAVYFQQSKPYPLTLRRIRNVAVIAIPILFFITFDLIINKIRFGSILSSGYDPNIEVSLDPVHFLMAFVGNLISPGRGILIFFPLTLLSVLGFRYLFRQDRFQALIMGAIIGTQLLFYVFWKDWGAGISWGPRFLIPLLPFLTLLGILGYTSLKIERTTIRRIILVTLLLIGFAIMVNGILFNFAYFYEKIQLDISEIGEGSYNYQFRYSPIFSGWYNLLIPEKYDIYWFQAPAKLRDQLWSIFILIAFISSLAYTTMSACRSRSLDTASNQPTGNRLE
jgi:hypothetical protein